MVYGHRLGKERGVQSVLWFRLVVSPTLIRVKALPPSEGPPGMGLHRGQKLRKI